jgi:caffeoyl-CoA O-methyltransferase
MPTVPTVSAPKSVVLTPELRAYLLAQSMPPDDILDDLARITRERLPEQAHMQVVPEQGSLLTFLAGLVGARNVVEVGTFTGYSTLCLARGLAPGGQVITCDISLEWTALAHDSWTRAGVAHLIDLRLGPALDTLRALPSLEHIDLAFIDADKPGYISYWEEIIPRMRPGGLAIVDNVLFSGEVLDPHPAEKPAAIRAFNAHAAADPRVELVIVPFADGLTLARKLRPEER